MPAPTPKAKAFQSALFTPSAAAETSSSRIERRTRADSTPLLPTIRIPVQIIVGDQDALTPPPLSEQMHRDISGSTLAVIPGAGHMSNMEQPAAFNEAMGGFLDKRV